MGRQSGWIPPPTGGRGGDGPLVLGPNSWERGSAQFSQCRSDDITNCQLLPGGDRAASGFRSVSHSQPRPDPNLFPCAPGGTRQLRGTGAAGTPAEQIALAPRPREQQEGCASREQPASGQRHAGETIKTPRANIKRLPAPFEQQLEGEQGSPAADGPGTGKARQSVSGDNAKTGGPETPILAPPLVRRPR